MLLNIVIQFKFYRLCRKRHLLVKYVKEQLYHVTDAGWFVLLYRYKLRRKHHYTVYIVFEVV